jgi:hypothetical protein
LVVRASARVSPDLPGGLLGGFEDPGDAIVERRVALRLHRLGREIVRASIVVLHRVGKLWIAPGPARSGPENRSASSDALAEVRNGEVADLALEVVRRHVGPPFVPQ